MARSILTLVLVALIGPTASGQRPNVILVMADDQGWGDAGYQGHPSLKTPTLDAMASSGVRFTRWYSGAPVCSPTRGTCLTGRHHMRYGIPGANAGHLPKDEPNLAAILKEAGYRTGHFGKWHLGTLTRDVKESNRGGRPRHARQYAPPWDRGFDVCFSTEAKVPTWDPMVTPPRELGGVARSLTPGEPYGTHFWTGPGRRVDATDLRGDTSELTVDRALRFIDGCVRQEAPFFCVVWFHAPHLPVVAGASDLALYAEEERARHRHYLGCITALDRALGRLRKRLRDHEIAADTMLWYCADNGPEGKDDAPGRAGGLRGRKRDLYEGGIRVPGLLEWPGRVQPRTVTMPCSTLDYLPTVLTALSLPLPDEPRAPDGIDIMPAVLGRTTKRARPIPFMTNSRAALIDDRWKIVRPRRNAAFELYDILADEAEARDLSKQHPEEKARLVAAWRAFQTSLPRQK